MTNLFSATLEELQQLPVKPVHIESGQIKAMIENADYLHRANIPEIPACLVYADALRLQQVFDNLFANSYKYARTAISVTAEKADHRIEICIEDFGGGVQDGYFGTRPDMTERGGGVLQEELPALKEKYKRGSNAKNIEGAGLGLFISDYFMKEMHGGLLLENGEHGLKVIVTLALSGGNSHTASF